MIRVKLVLGLMGILAALVGIALENGLVIWIAIGLLGASVLIRIFLAIQARRGSA